MFDGYLMEGIAGPGFELLSLRTDAITATSTNPALACPVSLSATETKNNRMTARNRWRAIAHDCNLSPITNIHQEFHPNPAFQHPLKTPD